MRSAAQVENVLAPLRREQADHLRREQSKKARSLVVKSGAKVVGRCRKNFLRRESFRQKVQNAAFIPVKPTVQQVENRESRD